MDATDFVTFTEGAIQIVECQFELRLTDDGSVPNEMQEVEITPTPGEGVSVHVIVDDDHSRVLNLARAEVVAMTNALLRIDPTSVGEVVGIVFNSLFDAARNVVLSYMADSLQAVGLVTDVSSSDDVDRQMVALFGEGVRSMPQRQLVPLIKGRVAAERERLTSELSSALDDDAAVAAWLNG